MSGLLAGGGGPPGGGTDPGERDPGPGRLRAASRRPLRRVGSRSRRVPVVPGDQRLVPDMTIRDEAAAALAAIHLAQRSELGRPRARPFGAAGGPEPGGATRPFHRPAYYRVSLAHIHATNRALFAAGTPHLNDLHQGLLGDCYFVATLGLSSPRPGRGEADRPGGSDGTFDVLFPDGEPVRVAKSPTPRSRWARIGRRSGALAQRAGEGLRSARGRAVARQIFEDAIDAPGQGGHATGALRCSPAATRRSCGSGPRTRR